MLPGLSYGSHTGSLAYPLRTRCIEKFDSDAALVVLDLVHPDNLGPLPPSPRWIAYRGEQIGVATYGEFWKTVWY
jgi:hypothetical protein